MHSRIARQLIAVLAITLCGAACSRRNATQHVQRGQTYFDAQRYAEAALEYRTALQLNPALADVRLKLGDTYMQQHDVRNALREYVRAADGLPNSLDAQLKA